MMDVVLVHPDIHWNTGNVGRTCVATGTTLHLVKPYGFTLDDRQLKRAGLDYWQHLECVQHESLQGFLKSNLTQRPMFFFSRFAKRSFWDAQFSENSVLVFGSETKGLPESLKKKYSSHIYQIPMGGPVRSLNLSTAVGIALFEALRQVR